MIHRQLTGNARPATLHAMQKKQSRQTRSGWRAVRAAIGVLGIAMLSGCVTVAAPDKPIVIELNINIRQEVVYKLDRTVGELIEQNEDIF